MSEPDSSRSSRNLSAEQVYWQLWRQGRQPDLGPFLAGQGALSPTQVAAVIAIDQYERWRTGERVMAEDYLARLPGGPDRDQAACDVIYGEYLLREQLGESPDVQEYQARFPDQSTLLIRQLELHRALAGDPSSHRQQGVASSPMSPDSTFRIRRSAPRSALQEEVPGYEILEEIARGGMGVVCKARQRSLDRIVALKLLQLHPGGDPTILDRMRREALITARMSHPNIVTVHDAGLTGSLFYLAMEYVAGIDLHRLVEREGPLEWGLACEYLRQAALGLQHAHAQGLVHRDIKPSNLIVTGMLLDGTGQRVPGTLKILDLGLARLVPVTLPTSEPGDQEAAPLTQIGAFMGTPDFIAPEQANDPRHADGRSDLYSLGCTFYFMLTGQAPFSGATTLAKLVQHQLHAPRPIEQIRPEVPPGLCGIVRRLLAKQPVDRFQTPADLVRALAPFLPGQAALPVSAPVEPPSARKGLVCRLTGHADWVKCVGFAPDGRSLASGSLDRTLRTWTLEPDGAESWRTEAHAEGVVCLAHAPDGRTLATGGQDRGVCLWDLDSRQPRWRGWGHLDIVDCIAFTPRGDQLLSGSHDGTLRLWDCSSGQQLRGWTAHLGPVWGVAVSPDGRFVLSGGQDRTLRLWELRTCESLAILPEQAMLVTALALSPDGSHALTGGMDGVLHLWDLEEVREVRTLEGHTARVTSLAFCPDGRRAVSGSRDQTVRIWDVRGGRQSEAFTGHTKWVTSVAWGSIRGLVASGSVDRSVCIWQT